MSESWVRREGRVDLGLRSLMEMGTWGAGKRGCIWEGGIQIDISIQVWRLWSWGGLESPRGHRGSPELPRERGEGCGGWAGGEAALQGHKAPGLPQPCGH